MNAQWAAPSLQEWKDLMNWDEGPWPNQNELAAQWDPDDDLNKLARRHSLANAALRRGKLIDYLQSNPTPTTQIHEWERGIHEKEWDQWALNFYFYIF